MTQAEWHFTLLQFIGLVLSLATFIGSIIAIYYTYQNLKEMRKQLSEQQKQYFEQNKGTLLFYICKSVIGPTHDLIIKNFGHSPAKLVSLKIIPDLDWESVGHAGINEFNISNLKNIYLAPQQHVGTIFDFTDFNENVLNVEICYETCEKVFSEQYSIDINYLHKILTPESSMEDELSALKNINKSITSLSNRFI